MTDKKEWRPLNWDNPYYRYEFPAGTPIGDLTCVEDCNVGNVAYEAGADAILKALLKLAEESPTKTFTIDSRTINIYKEVE